MSNIAFALEDFVTVTENNSNYYRPEDIVNICKRKNNSKRDFLFVNSLQGKHIPASTNRFFKLYDGLVSIITATLSEEERVVVIGFAETATAIGQYLAMALPNCCYYMQTTRERLDNLGDSLLEFEEEHSHATEQFLYGDIHRIENCDRIIFVDDEISTGNTVLNFIRAIQSHCNSEAKRYSVASLLNWQDDEWTEKFKQLGIDTYYVLRGKIKDINAKVSIPASNDAQVCDCIANNTNFTNFYSDSFGYHIERSGFVPTSFFKYYDKVFTDVVLQMLPSVPDYEENVLVLGTEEFMFTPMVVAQIFEDVSQANVWFHATTRSPIETSEETSYAINKRYKIASCYDIERITYIYNLQKYDKVYIITDVLPNCFFKNELISALVSVGCDEQNIFFITLSEKAKEEVNIAEHIQQT